MPLRAAAAADRPHRAVDRSVGRVEDLHQCSDFRLGRTHYETEGAPREHARALGVRDECPDAFHMHQDGLALRLLRDAVDRWHMSPALPTWMIERKPSVTGVAAPPLMPTCTWLTKGASLRPRILAGNDAHARWLDRPRLGLLPKPGARFPAIARCIFWIPSTRSARFVVATEQEKGWRGIPPPRNSLAHHHRDAAETSAGNIGVAHMMVEDPVIDAVTIAALIRRGLGQVQPARLTIGIVAQVNGDRLPASASIATSTLTGEYRPERRGRDRAPGV